MNKKLADILVCAVLPIFLILSILFFGIENYALISLIAVIITLISFFLAFEKGNHTTTKLIIIALMTAFSVIGRLIFAPIPGFKPTSAIIIIAALYFGKQAGFMTGALAAFISNFYFGQGPWTPFQMITWGLIGFIAGALRKPLKKSFVLLLLFGALSGIIFSIFMDMWSALWIDNGFVLSRFTAYVVTAIPVTVEYAISNVLFLAVLSKPLDKSFMRLKTKYDI